ncbi:hypothetical protein STTU_2600 [Streptomyces sp. Tu6071]|nr:hypothetical protein STTU_2600 [Streptomyces sp. Tu6071]
MAVVREEDIDEARGEEAAGAEGALDLLGEAVDELPGLAAARLLRGEPAGSGGQVQARDRGPALAVRTGAAEQVLERPRVGPGRAVGGRLLLRLGDLGALRRREREGLRRRGGEADLREPGLDDRLAAVARGERGPQRGARPRVDEDAHRLDGRAGLLRLDDELVGVPARDARGAVHADRRVRVDRLECPVGQLLGGERGVRGPLRVLAHGDVQADGLVARAVVGPGARAVADDAVLGRVLQDREALALGAVGGEAQRVRAARQLGQPGLRVGVAAAAPGGPAEAAEGPAVEAGEAQVRAHAHRAGEVLLVGARELRHELVRCQLGQVGVAAVREGRDEAHRERGHAHDRRRDRVPGRLAACRPVRGVLRAVALALTVFGLCRHPCHLRRHSPPRTPRRSLSI